MMTEQLFDEQPWRHDVPRKPRRPLWALVPAVIVTSGVALMAFTRPLEAAQPTPVPTVTVTASATPVVRVTVTAPPPAVSETAPATPTVTETPTPTISSAPPAEPPAPAPAAAPTAYRVLCNLKVLAWHLGEVIEHAPRGLVASLSNPAITITDSAFDGAPRDPRESVDRANAALATLREALAQAAVAADAA